MGAEKKERNEMTELIGGLERIGGEQFLAACAWLRVSETAKAIEAAKEAEANGEPADESDGEGDCGDECDEDEDEDEDEEEPDGDEEAAEWRADRRRAGRQEYLADEAAAGGMFGSTEREWDGYEP